MCLSITNRNTITEIVIVWIPSGDLLSDLEINLSGNSEDSSVVMNNLFNTTEDSRVNNNFIFSFKEDFETDRLRTDKSGKETKVFVSWIRNSNLLNNIKRYRSNRLNNPSKRCWADINNASERVFYIDKLGSCEVIFNSFEIISSKDIE